MKKIHDENLLIFIQIKNLLQIGKCFQLLRSVSELFRLFFQQQFLFTENQKVISLYEIFARCFENPTSIALLALVS